MAYILSWLSSKNGKRLTRFCVGGAALAIFGNHVVVQGPMLDKVIEIFQVYRYNKPKPLPEKVHVLIDEVLQDSKLKEEDKKKLKFFYIAGHEVFHFGGIESPWGAAIGIPFTFEDSKDINFGELRLRGKETIDWIIEGQDLLKSLTLSENAKKFALLTKIYSCNFSEVLQNAAIGALCFIIPARIAQIYNIRTNAFERFSLSQRNIRYLIFYAFGFLLYRLVKDPMKHLSEKKADQLAAEISPEYLNGGIEYYTKILMRNKALEKIINSKLWSQYDDHGNEKHFLLFPKLPITKRLDYLKDIKKDNEVKMTERNLKE